VVYPLNEILLLCLLAVLAGAETFVDTALSFRDRTPYLYSHPHAGPPPRTVPPAAHASATIARF